MTTMESKQTCVVHASKIFVILALVGAAYGKQIQCSISSSKELYSALRDPQCKGLKFKDFILSTSTLRNAFFKSTTHIETAESYDSKVYDSVVLSGTKLEPGAMFVLGDVLSQGKTNQSNMGAELIMYPSKT